MSGLGRGFKHRVTLGLGWVEREMEIEILVVLGRGLGLV
jgi:hypothetical protein